MMVKTMTKPAERVVYSVRAKAMRRRNRNVSAAAFRGIDGRWHTYLNAAMPRNRGHVESSLCLRCGHGYTHLMGTDTDICRECRGEDMAEFGLLVQLMCGVNLGWRTPAEMTTSEIVAYYGLRINGRLRNDRQHRR